MAARYRLKIYDTSSTLIFQSDDYNALEYSKLLNATGNYTLSLKMESLERGGVEDNWSNLDNFFVIERSDPEFGLDWYSDFEGFHRSTLHATSERGLRLCTSYGRTYEDLLNRRAVAYKAASAGANKTAVAVETAIKAYVNENACSQATVANGREVDGVVPGLQVVTDLARGAVVTVSYPWRNLLDTVKELCNGNGFWFSVVRSGTNFLFDAKPTYGVDRSSGTPNPVVFAEEFGNMVTPSYSLSRLEETNRLIVLGQGEDAARQVVIADDTLEQASSPWNIVERTHDARNNATTDGLDTEGAQELHASQAKENLSFQVLQSDSTRYGLHYNLGDIVTVRIHDIERNKRIVGVQASFSNGKESLSFQFSDQAVDPDPLRQILTNINSRLRPLETRQNP